MDVSWFRDLAYLARTGNFSHAAELSQVSQSALSRRVQTLERWVGVPLVDRSRQPVRLTEAGLQMLEAGQQALLRLETERSQIREAQSLPDKYVVTFGAQHSIGWRFYPAWLQAFEDAYGPILSRLRADDLPSRLEDLRQGRVDFVIAYYSAKAQTGCGQSPEQVAANRSLNSVVIGHDSMVPVSKPRTNGKRCSRLMTAMLIYPSCGSGIARRSAATLSLCWPPRVSMKGFKQFMKTRWRAHCESALATGQGLPGCRAAWWRRILPRMPWCSPVIRCGLWTWKSGSIGCATIQTT